MNYELFTESVFNPQLDCNLIPNNFSQIVPQTKMEIIPGGVSYSFISTIPNCSYQSVPTTSFQNAQSNLTIQQQIAMKQLELQQLQNVLLQEVGNRPFENKFHLNKNMSTSEIFEQSPIKQIEKATQSVQNEKNETGIQVVIRPEMKDSATNTRNCKNCNCKSRRVKFQEEL